MKEREIIKKQIMAITIGMTMVTGMLNGCSGNDQGQTTKAAETTAKAAADASKARGTDTTDTETAGVDARNVGGNLTLGTISSTGTFYYVGVAVGNTVSNADKLNVLVQSINDSSESTAICQTSDIDIDTGSYDSLYAVHNREVSYKDAGTQDVPEAVPLYSSQLHVSVNEESDITGISQLKGKKVCVDPQETSYLFIDKALTTAYGISVNNIEPFYMDYAESAQALADDDIDAAFQTGGYPIAEVQRLAATTNPRMLPVDGALMDDITREYPFIIKTTTPADIYENQVNTEEVETLGYQTCLFTSSKADEDQIYAFIKLMMKTLDTYKDTNDVTRQISKKVIATPYVPLHPGAERCYREAGVLK